MKTPAFQLYTGDWKKDPELSMCSASTRGIWIDLICSMHDNDRCGMVAGTTRELARMARCETTEMEAAVCELDRHKAAEISREENGSVTLVNRRMFDEYQERKATQLRQQKHRDRSKYKVGHALVTQNVTPLSRQNNAVSSSSSSKISPARGKQPDQIWVDAVGVFPGSGLADAWALAKQAAPAKGLSPEEYFSKALGAFVAWVDGVRGVRRPQKSPLKFVEHFARVQEILEGKREAVPAETPLPSRVHDPVQRTYQDMGDVARRIEGGD